MEPPEPRRIRTRVPSVDEILTTLVASGVLETLEISNEDLATARTDAALLETLKITYELLETFDDSGVLDTFFRLPRRDQANFLRWIGSADDAQVRGRRAETFVSALQTAPLEPLGDPREVRDLRAE
jgi:uncharacterized protein YdeI (YjbR/CyaY-like superfamily)